MPPHPHSTSATRAVSYLPGSSAAAMTPRLRILLLRHEYVAVKDRRHTEVRHIDQLRDIEINGHAHQYVGLLPAQPFGLDQIVDHVERGISGCQADVLGEVGERSYFLTAQIGGEDR